MEFEVDGTTKTEKDTYDVFKVSYSTHMFEKIESENKASLTIKTDEPFAIKGDLFVLKQTEAQTTLKDEKDETKTKKA